MDGSEFVDDLRAEEATPLGRLGSDKYLVAATEADLAEGPVWRTVATTAASGRDTFAAWADGATGPAAETFAAAAETEANHYDRVTARLDDAPTVDPGDPVHRALQSTSETVARAGAMVGRGLVADRTRLQVVNFFVNEGDGASADLARELRADASDQVADGAALLDTVSASDDWDRAREAAASVVGTAYDDYAERLEAMGVDPKPVC